MLKWSSLRSGNTPAAGKPAHIGALVRGHWAIENGLHWRRDALYREDHSQVRKGNAPRVMASLRNIAISTLRLQGETNPAKATRAARNYRLRALNSPASLPAKRLCRRPGGTGGLGWSITGPIGAIGIGHYID